MGRSLLVLALLVLSAASAHASTEPARCATGDMGPWLFGGAGGVVAAIPLLFVWLGRHFRRLHARQHAVPAPISLLVAERLARAVQRRAGVIAAVGIAGVPTLVVMNNGPLAILSTVVGCIGLRGFFLARQVLQLVEASGAQVTAEVHGPTVIVRSPTDEAQLDVTSEALAAALRHAVPTSIAKRS
ncbi:MAG TPA: hypothetical protein VHN14_06950 [Kofleriaceae bacterium]|jgi:hypothetical protein|nr:hypothetical protein [Kofleriaceae bacterium]